MQNRHDTIMDLWKQRNYPNFKMVEFDRFKNEVGHFVYLATAHNANNVTKNTNRDDFLLICC